jgi:hypothetical protein
MSKNEKEENEIKEAKQELIASRKPLASHREREMQATLKKDEETAGKKQSSFRLNKNQISPQLSRRRSEAFRLKIAFEDREDADEDRWELLKIFVLVVISVVVLYYAAGIIMDLFWQ